ncbi:hypothetical protein [Psychrobacter fjordensis]|uniref:hypothetical protein n=1 Tax=Psychrobacter fjordensis TaxID=664424 RepID=UPI00191B7675|nr:hypothetical protein [Psychrobacter fjordensis]
MIKLIFIAMSLSLASCTTLSTSKVIASEPALLQDDKQAMINEPVKSDKPVRCYEPTGYDNQPIPLDTGVLRENPINVVSKELFIERFKASPLNVNKRKKYGHQLLEQENFGMTETVNLVIDDHDKAAAILDQLYQQYIIKVKNNDVLSDGETLHSYVRYNGLLFEIWGINRTNHPIKECNFSFLTSLSIS